MDILASDKTDMELLTLAKTGDGAAVEAIIRRYGNMVRAKARLYFMLGAEHEDIMQEGLIGLFKAIDGFDEEKGVAFATFANLCINRQILSAIKAASRRKHSPLNSALSLDRPIGEEENSDTLGEVLSAKENFDPESMLITREMEAFLNTDCKDILSKLEYAVLIESIKGKGYVQIASEMNRSPKSIDNALQRIRRKLKDRL